MRPLMVSILYFGLSVVFNTQLAAGTIQQSPNDLQHRAAALHAQLNEIQLPAEKVALWFSLAELYEPVDEDSLASYVDKMLSSLDEDTSLVRKVQILKWASEISFRAKSYEVALERQLKYAEYADSLQLIEHQISLDSLALELTYEAQRDSIAFQLATVELTKERKLFRQRSFIQVGLVVFFVLLVLLFLLYGANKLRNESNVKLALLNEHLDDQNHHLETLNRTKTRFFSIIAHDLRGPMNTFTGFYRLLEKHIQKKYEAEEGFHTLSQKVNKSAGQITHLLDTLLDWALKEEGALPHAPVWVDVSSCVQENLELFEDQAILKRIDIEVQLESELLVFVDRDALMTILRNLLFNALKFTPEGGAVQIRTWKGEDCIYLSVSDTGVGMSESQMDHLFNETDFTSTKGTRGEKGTGLGMNLVAEFVRMNNGKIEVSSQLNKGSTFTISFPVITGNE